MDSLISQQAAIDTVKKYYRVDNDLLEVIVYELENLPSAQPEPHWIPCSERLPEKEEQVLIYAWNVHYVLAKYREIRTCDGIYKMAWVTEDAYSAPREIKYEVICWMPLPEPYRAERRTDERKAYIRTAAEKETTDL